MKKERKPWYTPRPLVAREIELTSGTILGGDWTRINITLTLHQCYIEAIYKVKPYANNPSLNGRKERFDTLDQYMEWWNAIKKTYGKRITRRKMLYATYDDVKRTFQYTPYENHATRHAHQSLKCHANKDAQEPLIALEFTSET